VSGRRGTFCEGAERMADAVEQVSVYFGIKSIKKRVVYLLLMMCSIHSHDVHVKINLDLASSQRIYSSRVNSQRHSCFLHVFVENITCSLGM
jgi:hypothetical protein